jgi:hypothetical protein
MADIHPVQAIWDDEIQPQMRYRMRLCALKAGGEGNPTLKPQLTLHHTPPASAEGGVW